MPYTPPSASACSAALPLASGYRCGGGGFNPADTSWFRPQASGPLTATGTVVKSGSRVGFTEGTVTDASGSLVATATSTLLIFDL